MPNDEKPPRMVRDKTEGLITNGKKGPATIVSSLVAPPALPKGGSGTAPPSPPTPPKK